MCGLPAVHMADSPSLKECFKGPSAEELDYLKQRANEATLARGRGRLTSGQFVHQSDIDGRAARVGQQLGKRPRLAED